MAKLTIVLWRDIPAQVIARIGRRDFVKKELNSRFAKAIDRAAMKSGAAGTDQYLSEWRKQISECGDDIEAEVAAEIARLEELYDDKLLRDLVMSGGYSPSSNELSDTACV